MGIQGAGYNVSAVFIVLHTLLKIHKTWALVPLSQE